MQHGKLDRKRIELYVILSKILNCFYTFKIFLQVVLASFCSTNTSQKSAQFRSMDVQIRKLLIKLVKITLLCILDIRKLDLRLRKNSNSPVNCG